MADETKLGDARRGDSLDSSGGGDDLESAAVAGTSKGEALAPAAKRSRWGLDMQVVGVSAALLLITGFTIAIIVTLATRPLHPGDRLVTLNAAFKSWESFVEEMPVPEVIDMRRGGSLTMYMATATHSWGGGSGLSGTIYGYGLSPETVTFPGPTILVQKGVPVDITWVNAIDGEHILKRWMEPVLVLDGSKCGDRPNCVITIVHVHGVEAPPDADGDPNLAYVYGEQRTDRLNNSQPSATLMYHDHAAGMTRLNVWAGLVGAYIIQDPQDEALGVMPEFDVPIIITDRMINSTDGNLVYPNTAATQNPRIERAFADSDAPNRVWVPEAYGTVNLINGAVRPKLTVPRGAARLRFINTANARSYIMSVPFSSMCRMIAVDGGLVRSPMPLTENDTITLFPFERIDLLCDFSNADSGTAWDILDKSFLDWNNGTPELMRVIVGEESAPPVPSLPAMLSPVPDLRDLWLRTGGATRALTMKEAVDSTGFPLYLYLESNNHRLSFMARDLTTCRLGTVERWDFLNPSADFHPFHWHLVHAQCGPSATSPITNGFKDVVPIPPADPNLDDATRQTMVVQTCYVACAPMNALLEVPPADTATPLGALSLTEDFGFPLNGQYVAHCHVLEHEENDMMTYFVPYGKGQADPSQAVTVLPN